MSRPPTLTPLKTIGHSTPRIDAVERVTGKATYSGDVHLTAMLYARILRSSHAHAQIRKIDVSKALALPGVKLVLTHENCTCRLGVRARSRAGDNTLTKSRKSRARNAISSTTRCAFSGNL